MSSRVHVLIAILQVSLWFYQGFVLEQTSPLGWALLGSSLFYHVLHALLPAGNYRYFGRKWFAAWCGWQLVYLTFPLVFQAAVPNFSVFLNTLAYSSPCLVLVVLPVRELNEPAEDDLPLKL